MLNVDDNTKRQSPEGVPLFLSPVKAGFPSPASDYVERSLNLHEHLVRDEAATFFLRVDGDSMLNAGIHDGDLLVVDRSIEPVNGKIVVVALDGELTVKRLMTRKGRAVLAPENPDFPVMDVSEREHIQILGVVTYVVHSLI